MKYLAAIILVLGFACTASPQKSTPTVLQDIPKENHDFLAAEEQDLIAILANENWKKSKNITQIVISDRTDFHDPAETLFKSRSRLIRELRGLKNETLEDFLNKRTHSKTISPKLEISLKYALIDKAARLRSIETDLQKNKNGWIDFSNEFPGSYGINEFSRVGFDREHKQALVFVAVHFGIDGGSGTYVLLEKTEGNWKISSMMSAYIS